MGSPTEYGRRRRADNRASGAPAGPLWTHASVASFPLAMQVWSPATPQADSIVDVSRLVLVVSAVIFVLVQGALLYFVFRFRRPKRTATDEEPPQFYGSGPIEVAWTVGPLLIVLAFFLVVMRTTHALRAEPKADPLHVTVTGYRWWWEYTYADPATEGSAPSAPIVTANELHVPTGKTIAFRLVSADVIHSFWLPRLNGKTDVIPGHPNQTSFAVRSAGIYRGQCAEFCGTQHANMMLRVVADPPARFRRWLEHQREPAVDDPSVRAGRDLFIGLACQNCHAIRGTAAQGVNGPDLTHLMSRETLAAGVLPNDRHNLEAWIRDPQAIKPGCLMPNMQLTESQVSQLTDYLITLD